MIKKYKKLSFEELSNDSFERKPYLSSLNLENARMCFRIASKLVPTIRKNYSSKYRKMGQPLTCPSCTQMSPAQSQSAVTATEGETDPAPLHSQSHILNDCIAVSDLRTECEPSDDHSLAEFFRKVVARHMELEDVMLQ